MTTCRSARSAYSDPLYSLEHSNTNVWFEDDISSAASDHFSNIKSLYDDLPPQTTFYWLIRAEEIIAAAKPASRVEAGGWFAARSTNWLISATQNFERRNLFTAYVHHALARFFDCFSSASADHLAKILDVEANDVSRLLNRSDWNQSSWNDNSADHLNSLKLSDAIFSLSHYELQNIINDIAEAGRRSANNFYVLKNSIEIKCAFGNGALDSPPGKKLALSLAEDIEAKMRTIRSEIVALYEISNKKIIPRNASDRAKLLNKNIEELNKNIEKLDCYTGAISQLVINMELSINNTHIIF